MTVNFSFGRGHPKGKELLPESKEYVVLEASFGPRAKAPAITRLFIWVWTLDVAPLKYPSSVLVTELTASLPSELEITALSVLRLVLTTVEIAPFATLSLESN